MKNSTKAQKQLEAGSVEMNMRIVFSNLDALRRVDRRGSWEKSLRKVRDKWMITQTFEPWMQHIVDVCYEKVLEGRGYGGVNEVKKKKWR